MVWEVSARLEISRAFLLSDLRLLFKHKEFVINIEQVTEAELVSADLLDGPASRGTGRAIIL